MDVLIPDRAWMPVDPGSSIAVIPAKAGIHFPVLKIKMDPGFRRDDGYGGFAFMLGLPLFFKIPAKATQISSATVSGTTGLMKRTQNA